MKKREKAQWRSPSAGKRQRLSLFFLSFSSSVYTGTSLTLVRDVDLAHGGPRREHSDLHVFKIKICSFFRVSLFLPSFFDTFSSLSCPFLLALLKQQQPPPTHLVNGCVDGLADRQVVDGVGGLFFCRFF
jgi:hypothetical protein